MAAPDPRTSQSIRIFAKLERIPLLNSLETDDLQKIACSMTECSYDPHEFLMKEGETGTEFFIILSGTCMVMTEEIGNIAELQPGDYCGEQALLNDCVRAASIQAKTRVYCVKMQQKAFNSVLGSTSKVQFAKRQAKRVGVMANTQETVREFPRKSVFKDEATKEWLLKCIKDNILFETMSMEEKTRIVAKMHKNSCAIGESIITEGEEGDEFFVVASGEFEIVIGENKVATILKGACCGELALMHDATRAATVRALQSSTVWVVQRSEFRNAIMEIYKTKDAAHIELLRSIEIFQTLLTNELTLISDACTEKNYEKGEIIVNEGDEGDTFYMIESGTAVYEKKNGDSGTITHQYFGELALVHNGVRRATVRAETPLKTLELTRNDFVVLLGPVEDIFKKRAKKYLSENAKKDQVQPDNVCELHDLKELGVLGKGAFGFVTLVEDPYSGRVYALKAIRKSLIIEHNQETIILREKNVMKKMRHRRLVNLYTTFKDKYRVYFLLDACLGGELFTILRKKRYFSEKSTKIYAACVIEGFEYMHGKDIIYRDLKPENLVLERNGYLKITDFGFAKHTHGKTFTLCGTPDYLAPEIVTGQGHGKGADWWTLGVFIYELLASVSPFYNSDALMMYRAIVRGKYRTPKYFSEEVEDLVGKLLYRRATKRYGIINGGVDLIKNHAWFQGFDWKACAKNQLEAPHIPNVDSKRDFSNFKQIQDNGGSMKACKLKFEHEF